MELVAQPLPSKNTEKDAMGEINKTPNPIVCLQQWQVEKQGNPERIARIPSASSRPRVSFSKGDIFVFKKIDSLLGSVRD